MFNLNLIDAEKGTVRYERLTFPDGQPHIKLLDDVDGVGIVVARITSPNELFEVAMVADILSHCKLNLYITYLMGARMDREIDKNQPFTLKTVAMILRMCRFNSITILDPHSNVSVDMLEAYSIVPMRLVKKAIDTLGVVSIVAPDKGARERVSYIAKKFDMPLVVCEKQRDMATGKLDFDSFKIVTNYSLVKGKDCLIVDDICDGGMTFVYLAVKLRKEGAKSVSLAVTHGIFSKGTEIGMDQIFTTNSYRDIEEIPNRVSVMSYIDLI